MSLPQLARWAALVLAVLACTERVAAAQPAPAPASTLPAVAVWDFDDTSAALGTADGNGFLRRTLAESLTATLLAVPGLPVVERQRLQDVLSEHKLAAPGLADDDGRLRLGRLLGAQRMVFGSYLVLGTQVQLDVRVVDTASSRVLLAEGATAPLAQLMPKAEALNQRVARALAGATPAGSGAGTASFDRASLDLWKAYDAALALADAGRLDEAVDGLKALLSRHGRFAPAERQLAALLLKQAQR